MSSKTSFLSALVLGTVLATHAQTPSPASAPERPPVSKEKAGYAIGVNIGSNWKRQEIEVDYNELVRGLKDAMTGTPTMTEAEIRETLMQFQQELGAKQQEKRRLLGEKNKTEGTKFLAENKSKPGVQELPSGLQYKVLGDGNGASPSLTDIVEVNYRGTLIDGTEFDASPAGQPLSRPLNQLIRGWQEAMTRMKIGGKWQLYVPADLAYGEFGFGAKIGPNATLIFDVELLGFKAPPPPPAPAAPLTSDIIRVPSAEEMKQGAKIETIKAEDVEKLIKEEQAKQKQPAQK
jgi:FKBP-type peptidyl-prolyl cis-trans isomerase FklB